MAKIGISQQSQSGCAWVYGIGENIVSLPSKTQAYLLIFPNIHCDTTQIYKTFDEQYPHAAKEPAHPICPNPLLGKNDLLEPALILYPELKKITDTLTQISPKQWYMSGSGSTLFIPFNTLSEAENYKEKLSLECPLQMVATESL